MLLSNDINNHVGSALIFRLFQLRSIMVHSSIQGSETFQQREIRPESEDFVFSPQQRPIPPSPTMHGRSHYQRVQFRRMYRYGLSLLLVGALCNWIGFAQHYFAPVRYLGVGCVVAGALCICIALCRWLTIRDRCSDPSTNQVGVIFPFFYWQRVT